MDASKANMARQLFEKYSNRLAAVGMLREDVSNSLVEHTAAGLNVKSKLLQPILNDGEDQDPENHEQVFEETFDGKMPDAIVGLMFDNKTVRALDAMDNEIEVPLWEKVLM